MTSQTSPSFLRMTRPPLLSILFLLSNRSKGMFTVTCLTSTFSTVILDQIKKENVLLVQQNISALHLSLKVKNTQNPTASMLHGLKAFKEDYPTSKTYLLHRGNQRLKIGDVLCLPIDQFLKDLIPNSIPD